MAGQQVFDRSGGDAPGRERVVEAAPAATMHGFHTEMWEGANQSGTQQGIRQVKQSVGTTCESAVQRRSEGAQAIE